VNAAKRPEPGSHALPLADPDLLARCLALSAWCFSCSRSCWSDSSSVRDLDRHLDLGVYRLTGGYLLFKEKPIPGM
jgi:hypothetical protein